MPSKQHYDLRIHRKEVLEQIRGTLGPAVYPSWKETRAYWQRRIKGMMPKGFMYVFDVFEDRTILSHGLSCLGYTDNKSFSGLEVLGLVHDNYRELLTYQIYEVHKLLLDLNHNELGMDLYYAGFRAVKDASGQYWLAYQTSEPFRLDKNGRQVSYLSWYHILAPYQGEAMQNFLFAGNRKDRESFLQQMNTRLQKIQAEQLRWLGFTETPLLIMNLYAKGYSKKNILAELNIVDKTLKNHHTSINENAKLNFPVNDFRTVYDVVDYLKKQNLLPI